MNPLHRAILVATFDRPLSLPHPAADPTVEAELIRRGWIVRLPNWTLHITPAGKAALAAAGSAQMEEME